MLVEKIEKIRSRNAMLMENLSRPEIIANPLKFKELAREQRELYNILYSYDKLQAITRQIDEDRKIIEMEEDYELVTIAKEELEELEEKRDKYEEDLRMLMIPEDPNDSKNAIIEIRAGTGGAEAAIFAGNLYKMYTRYCEKSGYKCEVLSSNPSEHGGFKEIIFQVMGTGAYGNLKFESGVHRVQRVPETEAQGRVHTSAASLVVLPEAEDIEIQINPNDLRIDVFRSSGPGGQSVNTTDSAVRITHIPTGLVVTCQDEKSQLKNKNKALKVLKARLLDKAQQEFNQTIASKRKSMVSTGDRSAKIRTYNYPQNRVTDHRINLTLYQLEEIMHGEIDKLIEELHLADQSEKTIQIE
jgi:peptide chain release factor 1